MQAPPGCELADRLAIDFCYVTIQSASLAHYRGDRSSSAGRMADATDDSVGGGGRCLINIAIAA